MNLQPYQEAGDQIRQSKERFPSIVKNVASTAAGIGVATAAGSLAARALPMLSKYIPKDMAIKGLSKINPALGKFAQMAFSEGYQPEEVGEFIKEKESSHEEKSKQEKTPEKRSIIQKYSDNLHHYISGLIQKGTPPIEAASKAKKFLDKPQLDIIKKIEKDYKTDFGSIVESIFGKGDMAQKPSSSESMEAKMAKFNEPGQQMQPPQQAQSQQMQQGQQQQAGLDPQVAQILQQGQALLQKFKR
jgi:hypothetical protein